MSRAFSHKWTIDNFSHFYNNNNDPNKHEFIFSKDISPNDNIEVYLELCPNGEDDQSGDCVSVFINCESYLNEQIKIDFKITFVNSEGELCFIKENNFMLDKAKRSGWSNFIDKRTLLQSANELLQNDKLILFCEIQIEELQVKADKTIKQTSESIRSKSIKYCHNWTIPNFKTTLLDDNHKPLIESPKFTPTTEEQHHFSLTLNPVSENDPSHVSLFLRLDRCESPKVNIRFVSSILNVQQNSSHSKENKWKIARRERCGWHQFVSHEQLLNPDNKFFQNNDLVIRYEVEIIEEIDLEIVDNVITTESVTDATLSFIPFSHKWTIEDFSRFLPKNDEINNVETTPFRCPLDDANEFYLKLQTKSENVFTDYLSIFLWFGGGQRNSTTIYFRLSILDNCDRNCATMGCQVKFDHKSIDNWGWHLISIEELIRETEKLLLDDKLTILCEIELIDNSLANSQIRLDSSSWFYGSAKLSKLAHKWTIDDFESFLDENEPEEMSIYSQNFTTQNNELQFYLRLYPNMKHCVSVYLCFASSNKEDVNVRCKLSIQDSSQNKCLAKELTAKFERGYENLGNAFQIKRHELTDELLYGGKLKIYCEVSAVEFMNAPETSLDEYFYEIEKKHLPAQFITQSLTNRDNFEPINLDYDWTIENVKSKFEQQAINFESEKLNIAECENLEFKLKLCPKETEDSEFVSFYLEVTSLDDDINEVTVRWNISIVDFFGDYEVNSKGGRCKFIFDDKSSACWGWPEFAFRSYLLNEGNGLINDDKLKLSFDAKIFKTENIENLKCDGNLPQQINLFKNPENTFTYTRINKITHHWSLENFGHYLDTNQEYVQSKIFPQQISEGNVQLYLRLYPFGEVRDKKDCLSMFLFLESSDQQKEVNVQCKLSILDINGKKFKTVEGLVKFSLVQESFGWREFFSRKDLFDSSNELLTNGTLNIDCEFYLVQSHPSQPNETRVFVIDNFETENWKIIQIDQNSSKTELPVFNDKYKWTINDFREKSIEPKYSETSPVFCLNKNENLKFHLKLENYLEENGEDKIKIYYYLDRNIDEDGEKLRFRISLLDQSENKCHTKERNVKLLKHEEDFEDHFEWGFLSEVNNLLLNEINRLEILFEVDFIHEPITVKLEAPDIRLQDKWISLLRNKPADVVLAFANEHGQTYKLYAHKCILQAQSKVFEAMFANDFVEKLENRVPIEDFDAKVGRELLRYFYTGNICKIDQFALDYFVVADKYELKELLVESENWISSHVSIEHACNLAAHAYRHNSPKLKSRIYSFFCINLEAIQKTEDFDKLERGLLADLLRNVAKFIDLKKLTVSTKSDNQENVM